MINLLVLQAAINLRPWLEFSCNADDSAQLIILLNGKPDPDQSALPSDVELQTEINSYLVVLARDAAIKNINDLRDEKKQLPILSEGYQVQTGTENVGAMATDMFSASGNKRVVSSLTSSGNVATMTFQKNHHMKNGVSFPVTGVDQPEYNVTANPTIVDKKTISYPISGPADSPATGNIVAGLPTFKWVDNDNNIVYWTEDEVKEIIQACSEYLDECTVHGVELKEEVRACATVIEINAIDITAGWPDTGL